MELSKNSLVNFIMLAVLGAIVGSLALWMFKAFIVPIAIIIGLVILVYEISTIGK